MALKLGAIEDAFIEAGVTKPTAQRAAEELTAYVSLDTKVTVLTWMVGSLYAVVVGLGLGNLWLSFGILSRLGGR